MIFRTRVSCPDIAHRLHATSYRLLAGMAVYFWGVYGKPSQAIPALLSRMTGMPPWHADVALMSASNADRAIRSLMSSCSLSHCSCWLLIRPLDNPCKFCAHVSRASRNIYGYELTVKFDVFTDNGALSLVVLVDGHLDLVTVDIPSTYATDKVVIFASREVQPRLKDASVNLAYRLADSGGNAYAHEFLKARNVGNQVGVEVVRVEGGPEGGVISAFEQVPQFVELLNSF